jgi:glucose/arabinose dehydrogenase
MFYSGSLFPQWQGNAFIGGLSSESLVRIEFAGGGAATGTAPTAREAERFRMRERIRAVEQGPDGAIWLLEDSGRLLRLTPREG